MARGFDCVISRILPGCALIVAAWFVGAPARADQPPNGPYQSNCTSASIQVTSDGMRVLQATCQNFYQQPQFTTLNAPESCPVINQPGGKMAQIYNVNGTLACNFKPSHQDQSGRDWVDWIGKTSWTDNANGIQKTYWEIFQPNNQAPFTPYPDITYMPGDTVNLLAGGCAQSGGSGNTWKRYVDPSGDSSGYPGGEYYGLAWIPGTDSKFDPPQPPPAIINILGKDLYVYNVPLGKTPYSLTLGYVDDGFPTSFNGYGDNGYYSHDDGDNGQCSASNSFADGPAWVIFEVDHPLKPIPAPYSSGSKPFDVVYNEYEANGLPMNPEWYWNLHTPSDLSPASTDPFLAEETLHVPDFNVRCGPAFSTRGTSTAGTVLSDIFLGPFASGLVDGEDASTQVDWGKLASSCTSQPVAVDQFYAFSDVSSAILSNVPNICGADPIRGHLNMQPVTYTGSLHFSDWSGVFPEDSDINMSLVPANKTTTGLLWGQTVGSKQMGKSSGSENAPYGGFLAEFDSNETVSPYFANRPGGSFWHAFAVAALGSGPDNSAFAVTQPPISDFQSGVDAANELMVAATTAAQAESPSNLNINAVVTGLMGIDGAHFGGIAELHPVFSMAIHQIGRDVVTSDGKTEHWSFFIRNQGDEGSCSDQIHSLQPEQYGARDYYIALPWPAAAGNRAYDHVSTASGGYTINATPWVSGSSVARLQSTPGTATYLHFLSPPYSAPDEVPFFGYDGEITLQYTLAGGTDRAAHDKAAPAAQAKNTPAPHGKTAPAKRTASAQHAKAAATQHEDIAESNDSEDFPWRRVITASNDPAVTVHLKKYFAAKQPAPSVGPALPRETQSATVETVSRKVVPRDARLPHRTHELADATMQRRNDEIARQEGSPRANFQAVDAQHVFFIGTDGDLYYKQGPFDASGAPKLVDHAATTFAAVSQDEVLKLEANRALYVVKSPFDFSADGSCRKGYVWRAAYSNDHVCVTAATHDEAAADNAAGPSHVVVNSSVKADTCISGYVWRQADDSDHVCVLPDVRAQTAEDNKLGPSRVASAGAKQFFGWPVVKYQAAAYGNILVLDAGGNLLSFSPPFSASSKPTTVTTKVRAFQAVDKTHTLVLTTDDQLRSYPPAATGTAPTYSNVWDFSEASDGSLFVIDGNDVLWSEQPLAQLDTDVRKVQAINASTIFELKNDGSLSMRQFTRGQSSSQSSLASNIMEFQAIDAGTVFALDRDGKLWVLTWSSNPASAAKVLVADDVR